MTSTVLTLTISTRYYNMMEETFLINIIKEKLCYVSQNFLHDLALTKRQVDNCYYWYTT